MITQELIGYIKKELASGKTKDEIVKNLLSQGWNDTDLEEAFKQIVSNISVDHISGSENLNSSTDVNYQNQVSNSEIRDLPSGWALLKEAWTFYQTRLLVTLGLSFLLTLFSFIYEFFIKNKLEPITSFDLFFSPSNIPFILGGILIFFIQIWIYLSLIFVIKDSEEKITILEALKRGKNKILNMFLVSILFFLIVIGGTFPLVIPGIILSISFVFYPFIIVSENLKGFKALVKSREYVKGYWWQILGRIFFLPLLVFLFSLAILFLVFVIRFLVGGFSVSFFGMVFWGLLMLILLPLFITYSFLIYKKIKIIKNNFIWTKSKRTEILCIVLVLWAIFLFLVFFYRINSSRNNYSMPEYTPSIVEQEKIEINFNLNGSNLAE